MVDLKDFDLRMDGAVDSLKKKLAGLRTGRASPAILEPVVVEAYGGMQPLRELATISVPEPRLLQVSVFDRSLAKAVDKAIRESGLGLNPQTEGQTIRVTLPELNEQRRNELAKVAQGYAEEARVAVRNVRREAMDALKKAEKDGKISQDEKKKLEENVQKMTDGHIKRVDETVAAKEKEIRQV